MTETRKLRVFLCHSSQDKPVVRELYQRLKAEGWIDPWLDEEKLLPGMDWDMEIEKAVESADAVIVCLSNNSVSKEGYVQRELKFAYEIALEKPEGAIFIIPLRFDDCIVPRRLREWQYVDSFPPAQKEWTYTRLLESLKQRAQIIAEIMDELKRSEKEKLCQKIQLQIQEEENKLNDLKLIHSSYSLYAGAWDENLIDELWNDVPSWKKYVGVGLFFLSIIIFVPACGEYFYLIVFPNDPSLNSSNPSFGASLFMLAVWAFSFFVMSKTKGLLHRLLVSSVLEKHIKTQENKISRLSAEIYGCESK